jgi:hypothetical protein
VRQLAVRPIDLTPLVEQRHDLGGLIREQAVHRVAARRPVDQLAAGAAGQPPPRTRLVEFELAACAAQRPARGHRVVEQREQPGLGGRVHPAWDPATQPQLSFPPPASA